MDIYVIHSFQIGSPMVYHMIFIFEIRDTAPQTNYGTADRETAKPAELSEMTVFISLTTVPTKCFCED